MRALQGILAQITRRLVVDRVTLVELIEGETARLSPKGRELWEEMETLVELSPEEQTLRSIQSQQEEISNRMYDELPLHERHVIDWIYALSAGLADSDKVEKQGESGEKHRDKAVVLAAQLKDKYEGRQIDPDMTLEQAVSRLRES
jgi:hypothetical protein